MWLQARPEDSFWNLLEGLRLPSRSLPLSFCHLPEDEKCGLRRNQLGKWDTEWPRPRQPKSTNHRAVRANLLQGLPRVGCGPHQGQASKPGLSSKTLEGRTVPAPNMRTTAFQAPRPGPAPSSFWFDVSPAAQGRGEEGRTEGGYQGSELPDPEPLEGR